jgi:hypothetical protein
MSVAVPLVQDDRFWLDNPSCQLVRGDVEVYLDELAVASEHAEDPESESSLNTRGVRRRIMRLRIRGKRPDDPIKVKTIRWFMRPKKETPKHPRYKRTVIFLSHAGDGQLKRKKKRCPKPAPNRRRDFSLVNDDRRAVAPQVTVADTATTEVSDDEELVEGEVVLERTSDTAPPLARVILPHEDEPLVEFDDSLDPELVSLLVGEVDPAALIDQGCSHVEDGGGSFSRRVELEKLARAAQTEPDWGNPDDVDFGQYEPTYLQIRT